MAVADFTGDGREDVVVSTLDSANFGVPDHVHLFVQGADGWFARVDPLETDLAPSSPGGVAAGDLDGDGRADAVVATGRSLDIFVQRDGRLAPGRSIPVDGVAQVEVADVDGDGRTDMLALGTGGVALLRGEVGGTFAPARVVTTDQQLEAQVGDVTGDGRADIVGCAMTEVRVFAQDAAGGFGSPGRHPAATGCASVALADVDGDGRLDASYVGGGNAPGSRLAVLLQRTGGTLAPPITYPTRDIPGSVKAGDMNGDGRMDLVVLHEAWMWVGVHAQAPDRSLDPERLYGIPYANGGGPKALDTGDVNGDGHTDIVIADDLHGLVVLRGRPAGPSTTTSTSVLPATVPTTAPAGSPPPLFSAVQSYDMDANAESLAAGDFNGDGRVDVAMSSGWMFSPETRDKLWVFYQGPDGSLQRAVRFDTDKASTDPPGTLAAGDLDGDGRTDLVLRMREGIDVFMQRGGTFADRKFVELPYPSGVDVADLDRDGKADLVMTGLDLTVYRSLGPLEFAPPVTITSEHRSESVIGDVTGDGRLDIVSTNNFRPGSVEVFAQKADGTYAPGMQTATGGAPGDLALGDYNNDGRLDVAVTHVVGDGISIQQVRILLQGQDGKLTAAGDITVDQPGAIRAGDVNGDGRTDLAAVYGGWRAGVMLQQADGRLGPEQYYPLAAGNSVLHSGMVLADITGDGRLDVAAANNNFGIDVLRNAAPAGSPPLSQPGGAFHSLVPARILDTRAGVGAPAAKVGQGATVTLQVTGRGGVPASGVSAVVMNVTVTEPTAMSFLTAWPTGEGRPLASNLNYVPSQTVPNLVVVKVGAGGRVDLFNSWGSTHVIADVAGWYGADAAVAGAAYTPLAPARILDTRTGAGAPAAKVGPAGTLALQVAGQGGVPATGVSAVVLNVTVTEPTASGHVTVWPAGVARPLASNLNYGPGMTVPNLVVVKVGAGGKVNLFNSAGSTHLVADVAGWYGTDTVGPAGTYTALPPSRILDTRTGVGAAPGQLGPSGTLGLQVAGRGGVPTWGVSAVVLNVTVTEPSTAGHLTAWPAGQTLPSTSNLNYEAGQTVPNLVVVKVGTNGRVNLFNSAGATHVVADVAGWYTS